MRYVTAVALLVAVATIPAMAQRSATPPQQPSAGEQACSLLLNRERQSLEAQVADAVEKQRTIDQMKAKMDSMEKELADLKAKQPDKAP